MTGDEELSDDEKDSTKSDEEERFDYYKFFERSYWQSKEANKILRSTEEGKPLELRIKKYFKTIDSLDIWKKNFVKKSNFTQIKFYDFESKIKAQEREVDKFNRLFDSYAVFVNQVDYSKNKKVFFDYVKEEISTEKIDREGVIKLISLIIQNLDWVDENGTEDEFEKSRGELEAAIPLAASINSTDLTYLVLNLLAELCKYRGVDDSKYRKQSEIAIEKSSKEEDDDDEDWMWVLSPFANDDDTAAAAA